MRSAREKTAVVTNKPGLVFAGRLSETAIRECQPRRFAPAAVRTALGEVTLVIKVKSYLSVHTNFARLCNVFICEMQLYQWLQCRCEDTASGLHTQHSEGAATNKWKAGAS